MMYLNVYYCEDCEYEWETESETPQQSQCVNCGQETEPVVSADISQYQKETRNDN